MVTPEEAAYARQVIIDLIKTHLAEIDALLAQLDRELPATDYRT